ncbi:MAG TPA: hypothetical protein VFR27_13540 [Mycobacterium sp.]|nr:hypothetical protein [Mycobacterium sp.]
MAAQPIGPGRAAPSAYWYAASPTCNRAYLAASVRAGVIAMVLLAMLIVIVLL